MVCCWNRHTAGFNGEMEVRVLLINQILLKYFLWFLFSSFIEMLISNREYWVLGFVSDGVFVTIHTVKPAARSSETTQKTKEPINLEEQILSDIEAAREAELQRCCSSGPVEWESHLEDKRSLELHVSVENNDSDVEDEERMKPAISGVFPRKRHMKMRGEVKKWNE